MSEDPALLQNQYDYADLAAKVAYQQAIIHGEDETRALNAAIQAADNQLKALGMVTGLQGPRNAFQQQAMEVGLNGLGYSRAFDALAGRYAMPAFGRQFSSPQPQSIYTMAQDISANPPTNAQDPVTSVMNQLFGQLGWTTGSSPSGYGAPAAGTVTPTIPSMAPSSSTPSSTSTLSTTSTPSTTTAAAPSSQYGDYSSQLNAPNAGGTYMPSLALQQQMLGALPAPNKIDVRNWSNMSPDTQQFLLGAYSTSGQSPTDVQNAIAQSAPQFRAPRFGSITGG